MNGLDLRTIGGIYVGDTKYSEVYLGDQLIYPHTRYIDNGTSFYDIDTETLAIGSMMSTIKYQVDANDEISSTLPIINAIDIDWNDPNIGTIRNIRTSGDLLKIIDDIAEGINELGGSSFDWEHSDIVYVTDSITNIPIGQHPRYVYVTGSISTNYEYPNSPYYFGRTNTEGILEWDAEVIPTGSSVPQECYIYAPALTRMYKWNTTTQEYENWIPMTKWNSSTQEYDAEYDLKYRVNGATAAGIWSLKDNNKQRALYFAKAGDIFEYYIEYIGPDGVTYRSDFDLKIYNSINPSYIPYNQQYLTFEAIEDGTFSFSNNDLQYSLDNGSTWTTLTAGTATPTVYAGNKILWRQSGLTPSSSTGIGAFSATGNFKAYGNIMSLYYDRSFYVYKDLTGKPHAFYRLFYQNTKLVDISNLILPATTLANNCYYQMFRGCTSLTTAPELPATTLTYQCYRGMFQGCSSLTTAPELPATILAEYCYQDMFNSCTSLTTAPELTATTLASNCYHNMFRGCTSLTTAPELPATTLVQQCYYYMFRNCPSLKYIKCLATDISANSCTSNWVSGVAATGTFVKNVNMSNWTTGINGIPSGWTTTNARTFNEQYLTFEAIQDTKFTFTNNDLQYSLDDGTTWTTLYANTSSPTVTAGNKILWKQTGSTINNTGIGRFSATGKFDAYGNIMSLLYGDNFINQTTLESNYVFKQLFYANKYLVSAANLKLPATTLSQYCYQQMFRGCTSLNHAPELPATTLVKNCYEQMFYGCIALTTAPDLLATTLVQSCYRDMFNGSSLNYVKCLATNKSATYCTKDWLVDVIVTGTFVKDANTTWSKGSDGIPSRWSVQNA